MVAIGVMKETILVVLEKRGVDLESQETKAQTSLGGNGTDLNLSLSGWEEDSTWTSVDVDGRMVREP